MKLTNIIKGNLTILRIALQQNKSTTEVRHDMQETLDAAWAETWTPGNIRAQVKWQQLFPGCQKPTLEEFIICIAQEVKAEITNKTAQAILPN